MNNLTNLNGILALDEYVTLDTAASSLVLIFAASIASLGSIALSIALTLLSSFSFLPTLAACYTVTNFIIFAVIIAVSLASSFGVGRRT